MKKLHKMTLMDAWSNYFRSRGLYHARQLFPNRQKGYVKVTKDIGLLAANLHTANILSGKRRSMYIKIADDTYDRLPDWGKRVALKVVRNCDISNFIQMWVDIHEARK